MEWETFEDYDAALQSYYENALAYYEMTIPIQYQWIRRGMTRYPIAVW